MRRLASGLVVGVLVVSCGGGGEGGAVRFAGSGEPVAGATITPLVGSAGPTGDLEAFAADPNTSSTITDQAGEFTLEYGVRPSLPGVQITVAVPSVEGPAVGRLDWRGSYDPDAAVSVEIPKPRPCESGVECGTELLPDLVPIISWDDVSTETLERLEPQTVGPPSAGLFPAETWFVEEQDGRTLLRFATVAANLGTGPLDVIASPDGDVAQTWQRVWTDTWHFEDRLSGEFLYHPTHDHIHFDAFERYRLIDDSGEIFASSEKVSFCLRDSVRITEDAPSAVGPMLATSSDCGGQQQVINAGFGDHYHALLDDQWIDVTGVAPGSYLVEVTVDPLNLITESNEDNNVGTFNVEIG